MQRGGGPAAGSGIAALINTLLPPAAVESWAWRVPFLLGGLRGPVGLYMRRSIDETPAFVRIARDVPDTRDDGTAPVWLAARAFGFTILWTVSYYVVLTYMPTFLRKHVQTGRAEALWATTAGLLVLVVATAPLGLLSDRIGRKPLLLASCIAFIVLPYGSRGARHTAVESLIPCRID